MVVTFEQGSEAPGALVEAAYDDAALELE